MNLNGVFGVASALVGVAMVTTIVSHKESAKVIAGIGKAFADAMRAAQGR